MRVVDLRDMVEADLQAIFEHRRDPQANRMAAFTLKDPDDWDEFCGLWRPSITDACILSLSVVVDGTVAGYVIAFQQHGHRSVGYWIGRPFWGRGVAPRALTQLIERVPDRPLDGCTATDNLASRRALEQCGFAPTGSERVLFSNARGENVTECEFALRA